MFLLGLKENSLDHIVAPSVDVAIGLARSSISSRRRTSIASPTSAAISVLGRKQRIVRRQSPAVTAPKRELYILEDDCDERDRRVN